MRRLLLSVALAAGVLLPAAGPIVGADWLGPSSLHEATAMGSWRIPGSGATGPTDVSITVRTMSGSATSPGIGGRISGGMAWRRVDCSASSDTYLVTMTYANFDLPRNAMTISGNRARFSGEAELTTLSWQGSECAQPDRYLGPPTTVGSGVAQVTAGWTVTGDWDTTRECGRDLRMGLIWARTMRGTSDVAAWLTVRGFATVDVGASQLIGGSLSLATSSLRPDNGTRTCDYWF